MNSTVTTTSTRVKLILKVMRISQKATLYVRIPNHGICANDPGSPQIPKKEIDILQMVTWHLSNSRCQFHAREIQVFVVMMVSKGIGAISTGCPLSHRVGKSKYKKAIIYNKKGSNICGRQSKAAAKPEFNIDSSNRNS